MLLLGGSFTVRLLAVVPLISSPTYRWSMWKLWVTAPARMSATRAISRSSAATSLSRKSTLRRHPLRVRRSSTGSRSCANHARPALSNASVTGGRSHRLRPRTRGPRFGASPRPVERAIPVAGQPGYGQDRPPHVRRAGRGVGGGHVESMVGRPGGAQHERWFPPQLPQGGRCSARLQRLDGGRAHRLGCDTGACVRSWRPIGRMLGSGCWYRVRRQLPG